MTVELDALAAQVLDQYPGPEHATLQALIVALLDLVDTLTNRVAELEAEAGRHSANSSKPPSGDTLTQRQAQKERRQEWTNKGKPKRGKGKQPGAPGAHLAQVEHPDETVPHTPERCAGCGASLADAEVVSTETRQVFDIPTPRIVVTEHVVETRRCSCGCESSGEFPPEATAPATYGPVVSGVGTSLLPTSTCRWPELPRPWPTWWAWRSPPAGCRGCFPRPRPCWTNSWSTCATA